MPLKPIPRVVSVEPVIAPQTEVEEMLHRVGGIIAAAVDIIATINVIDIGGVIGDWQSFFCQGYAQVGF